MSKILTGSLTIGLYSRLDFALNLSSMIPRLTIQDLGQAVVAGRLLHGYVIKISTDRLEDFINHSCCFFGHILSKIT